MVASRWWWGRSLRFTIHTEDGDSFVVKDRGAVIAKDVLAKQIRPIIRRRIRGDAWRLSFNRMCSAWSGHGSNRSNEYWKLTGWDKWASIRTKTWNDRGRAMINLLNRGAWSPTGSLHVHSKLGHATEWDRACKSMSRNYQTPWSKLDEWSKWSTNTASNQRRRMRRKAEKAES